MSVRIAYRKTKNPDILVSSKFVGNQGAIYEVELNTKEMTYRVKNVNQRKIVRSNEIDGVKPPTHEYTLRVQAKKALKKMGVKFEAEIRGLDV